jgi:hypothetical protein
VSTVEQLKRSQDAYSPLRHGKNRATNRAGWDQVTGMSSGLLCACGDQVISIRSNLVYCHKVALQAD